MKKSSEKMKMWPATPLIFALILFFQAPIYGAETGDRSGATHNCLTGIYASLSKEEREALTGYVWTDYQAINRRLRSRWYLTLSPSKKKTIDLQISNLKHALAKLPTFRGTVYRGTVLPKTVAEKLIPKQRFNDKAFMSCTRNRSVVSDKMGVPASNESAVIFTIESVTGKDISSHSPHSEEQEVLFRPGAEFEVISTATNGNVIEVHLLEVSSPTQY